MDLARGDRPAGRGAAGCRAPRSKGSRVSTRSCPPGPAAPTACCSATTSPTGCSARAADRADVRATCGSSAARSPRTAWSSVDIDLVHRPVRPGARDAGQRTAARPADRVARRSICGLIRDRCRSPAWPPVLFRIDDNVRRRDRLLSSAPHSPARRSPRGWRAAPQGLLDEMQRSGLRGPRRRGLLDRRQVGGVPRGTGATARYVVCNADEGEPGTFKDRVLLQLARRPRARGHDHRGAAPSARRSGLVYLRGEYRYLLEHARGRAAAPAREGLLGARILGRAGLRLRHRDPRRRRRLRLRRGVGADRVARRQAGHAAQPPAVSGHPRLPGPAHGGQQRRDLRRGRLDRAARRRLVRGASARRESTRHQDALACPATARGRASTSTRSASPCAQVLADCGARDTQAVQVGGPSGTCLSAAEFDRRIAFEDLPTAGAFMVFDRSPRHVRGGAQLRALLRPRELRLLHAVPGRHLAAAQPDGQARSGRRVAATTCRDLSKLDRLMQAMSHCGLGHTAATRCSTPSRKFRPAYERRLQSLQFGPAFDLDAERSQARAPAHRPRRRGRAHRRQA